MAWGILGLIAGTAAVWCYWPRTKTSPPVPDEGIADFDEPRVSNPGYVGAEACISCHADRVAEFRETRHFQACVTPEAGHMPIGFEPGLGTCSPRGRKVRFVMSQSADEFLQTTVNRTRFGEQQTSSRIALVYGAGIATDEVYFAWRGDGLFELPVVWLHPVNRWGTSLFDPRGEGDFSRPLAPRCLECHVTWAEHMPGTPNRYRPDSFILGVTCERCHGPGQEHVAFHKAHPDERRGKSILRPDRLTRERQIDLCAQCHSNAIKYKTAAFSYRAGEPLDEYFKTLRSERPEDDHVANQVQYFRQSKCFQSSEMLTCTTCHNPHRSERGKEIEPVRRACLQCHRPADCSDRDRLPAGVQDRCTDCHMPRFNKIQVRFRTEDDDFVFPARRSEHRIAVYPGARLETLLRWHEAQSDDDSRTRAAELKSSLAEHWLAEAERFRKGYRYLAAIDAYREALRFDPAESTRNRLKEAEAIQSRVDFAWHEAEHQITSQNYPEAMDFLQGILREKPDDAKAHGELGKLYLLVGRKDKGVEHLEAVARYDPDDAYGHGMLGWLSYLDDRAEEALEHYRRADEAEPFNAKIQYQMGLAWSKLGRWESAGAAFQRALTIDPAHVDACREMNHVLREQERAPEALRYARLAAHLTDDRNPEVLMMLAETYRDLGRSAEAESAGEKALRAAGEHRPDLVFSLRLRLDAIRGSKSGR